LLLNGRDNEPNARNNAPILDGGRTTTGAARRNMTVFGHLSSGLPRRAARAMTTRSSHRDMPKMTEILTCQICVSTACWAPLGIKRRALFRKLKMPAGN
jgi:hypothetical protein